METQITPNTIMENYGLALVRHWDPEDGEWTGMFRAIKPDETEEQILLQMYEEAVKKWAQERPGYTLDRDTFQGGIVGRWPAIKVVDLMATVKALSEYAWEKLGPALEESWERGATRMVELCAELPIPPLERYRD